MTSMLKVAIANSESMDQHGGISRVLRELMKRWDPAMMSGWAQLVTRKLPLASSYPIGIDMPRDANLIYLPRTGGTTALRHVTVPSVVTVHDVGFWDCPADKKALGWRQSMVFPHFRNLQHATRIITVSQFTATRLEALLPGLGGKIQVVPLGVSQVFRDWNQTPSQSLELVRTQFPQASGTPLLIYAGDDAPRKNLPLLLRVFREVKRRFPQAQLLKVGKAKAAADRHRTQETVRELGLIADRDVLFLDEVDDALLAALYAAADLFISASLYEGFGLPPLEAIAVGTPAVVTRRGAFPEILGNAATIVEPEGEPMTRAVLSLLNGAERWNSGDLRRFAARYSWDRAAQRYASIFYEALSTKAAVKEM